MNKPKKERNDNNNNRIRKITTPAEFILIVAHQSFLTSSAINQFLNLEFSICELTVSVIISQSAIIGNLFSKAKPEMMGCVICADGLEIMALKLSMHFSRRKLSSNLQKEDKTSIDGHMNYVSAGMAYEHEMIVHLTSLESRIVWFCALCDEQKK